MRALFIGGTGTISMAISRLLVEQGWELYLLNRGSRKNVLDGQAKQIVADISKEQEVAEKIAGMNFDRICSGTGGTGLPVVCRKDEAVYVHQFCICLS